MIDLSIVTALEECIRQAGRTVLQMARDGFQTARKANQDPVTTADIAADRILKRSLLERLPEAGWLSEETRDDPARLAKSCLWIVDPIDGTREFVMGLPEFAVSVALVERGAVVAAGVFNPAADEMFIAGEGLGARLNGRPIRASRGLSERLVILASRSEINRGRWKPFERVAQIRPVGSIAYKLALVAAGRADATFSLGPKNEWDIAAGAFIVNQAGGRAADLDDRDYRFNQPDTLVNGIVAATAEAYDRVKAIIARHGRT